ncbi:hypothetical protein ACIBCH_09825 [Amycolatopsis thailandensis]|uniref:hypothetical protein n=1 Tax=Amycolatopsis thailandensis TaxID=589330 RepID=UPI00379B3632
MTNLYLESDAGKCIWFPTPAPGNVYRIVSVNESMETLTYEVIGDPLDRATGSFASLAAVDAVVLPEQPGNP